MCDTCGCTQPEEAVTISSPKEKHNNIHTHDNDNGHDHHAHSHSHHHDHSHGTTIAVETDILSKNNMLAERNRGYLEAKNIFTINLVSSPGSGKTTILEKTLTELKNEKKFYVIEGDQQTMNDADRIDAVGVPVMQVNTGNGCHLDSDMVNKAIKKLDCPSLFDLGESKRVVIISVTEGEDKPIKYPNMFESSDLCIINKIDLLPYVDFNVDKTKEYALKVNHHLEFIELSARSGEGFDKWLDWLKNSKQ